ncbi:oligo-1,6-glucosidase [Halobiforma haloterrestris]|uniref:Oligo-1,6-glucosidase n=1 Tax=Natronobacterium haloterrestre TaxID=148448 RepID=A0A1I1KPZ0_NATHA|nr:hypothetical protein [Halobiforma haloterrestris]SFC62645.1 oligo-1,6-glucosidase [Halobiforma haloterrestris]
MTNTTFETPDEIRDVEAANFVEAVLESGEYDSYEEVRSVVEARSRDNARTPMQWSDEPHAGFTGEEGDGEPWLPVNDDYESVNVAAARADGDSIWHYYRELIDLREPGRLRLRRLRTAGAGPPRGVRVPADARGRDAGRRL